MTDFGVFTRYEQALLDKHPLKDDKRAICIQNERGVDYYALRNQLLAVGDVGKTWLGLDSVSRVVVQADTIDDLFPQNLRLVSIPRVSGNKRGMVYADGNFSTYVEPPKPVTEVTAAQAKVALYKRGYLDTVKGLVALYGVEAQLWYDNANTWYRSNPYNQGISIELGLTEQQEDDLWAFAALQ